jgi:hypothetical protein
MMVGVFGQVALDGREDGVNHRRRKCEHGRYFHLNVVDGISTRDPSRAFTTTGGRSLLATYWRALLESGHEDSYVACGGIRAA